MLLTATHVNIYFDVNGVLESSNSDDDYRVITNPNGANYQETNSALIYVPALSYGATTYVCCW